MKAYQKIFRQLDVIGLIRKLDEIEKLKRLILDDQQLELFDFAEK
jgi:hypothetical protein